MISMEPSHPREGSSPFTMTFTDPLSLGSENIVDILEFRRFSFSRIFDQGGKTLKKPPAERMLFF